MILVHTYAKVCTTSITEMLTSRFPGEVFCSHGLESWLHEPLGRALTSRTVDPADMPRFHTDAPDIARRLAGAMTAGEPVTIVSGVRDPIARSIAVAIQNFETDFADCRRSTTEATADALATRIADLWIRDTPDGDPGRTYLERMIRAPLLWFREEIEKPFGFDLQSHPFDRQRGYSIFAKGNVRLLLFRHENAPAAIEYGLAELFPGADFELPHANDGTSKPTAAIYHALKKCFRLPRSALDAIYGHPDVSRYFGADEIAAAVDRWAEDGPAQVPAAAGPTFAASVFIPVRNHAAWIGQQLDSLFSQWRPDIELILVDDGSEDGSLAVALDRLAGRPEVAATVMRNSQPIGQGMLSGVASLARAPVLIQADSDDITLPGRLDTIIDRFAVHPDCRLFTSNAVLISEGNVPISLLATEMPDTVFDDPVTLADRQTTPCFIGATAAYHRSIIEDFPPLDPELCPYGFDLLTGLRATLLGSQHFLSNPLVGWRQHARNSHRLSGWTSEDVAGQEHSAALNLMVCAQRLRDVAWIRSQGKLDPARGAAAETRWTADLLVQADRWTRLRNRLTGTHATPVPQAAGGKAGARPYVPAVPPILTLMRGHEYPMERIGSVLAQWSGFHQQESAWIWTRRQAIVVLRIPDPAARALVVTLAGVPYHDGSAVFLSVNFDRPVEIRLGPGQSSSVEVPITRSADGCDGLVTLAIDSRDALRPSEIDPQNGDTRLLGAVLFAFRVV